MMGGLFNYGKKGIASNAIIIIFVIFFILVVTSASLLLLNLSSYSKSSVLKGQAVSVDNNYLLFSLLRSPIRVDSSNLLISDALLLSLSDTSKSSKLQEELGFLLNRLSSFSAWKLEVFKGTSSISFSNNITDNNNDWLSFNQSIPSTNGVYTARLILWEN